MGSPEAHWVNSIICYIGGGSESTWPFLRLCGISLWVKKGHLNWGFKQEILLKTSVPKKF